ncbi:hypothetical protein BGZ94_005364 [Podila epigama]|nr:hypothetical protein BGZ94_005364 [Podila epigama]
MKDATAAIWITDVSSNGVWVNEQRIPKNEATKIYNRDIIAFTPGTPGKDSHAYMLMDKRPTTGSVGPTKRPLEDEKSTQAATGTSADQRDEKKPRLDAEGVSIEGEVSEASKEDKEKEDTAFEREFECGICHEIMHRALVLQPCLHSFCRECCKMWLRSNKDCPTCRQHVTRTKRDFKLNNLISLFLKSRPHMAREDLEDEDAGAESDTSNIIPEPRQRRRRRRDYDDDDDDDDEEDEENEDEDEEDDDNDDGGLFANGFPPFFVRQPVTCPCCLPNNPLGYVCPDNVRLAALPDNATFAEYQARLAVQPGHDQCQECRIHIPALDQVPEAIANHFRCKMCLIVNCGCKIKSVDDRVAQAQFSSIFGFFNPTEIHVIYQYLIAQHKTSHDIWQEVKRGMDDGTLYYLGTSAHPLPPPTAQPAVADNNNGDGDGVAAGAHGNAAAPANAPPANADPGMVLANRARTVTSSDKLCSHCSLNFFNHGPLYQWRKALDPATLLQQFVQRENCWYGRECRTQHNPQSNHARRLNHICEKTYRGR